VVLGLKILILNRFRQSETGGVYDIINLPGPLSNDVARYSPMVWLKLGANSYARRLRSKGILKDRPRRQFRLGNLAVN